MNIKENLFDIATVFWRDWVVLKRRMAKFILSRMVAPMLYLVAFGWGLGRSIQVASGTYLDFLHEHQLQQHHTGARGAHLPQEPRGVHDRANLARRLPDR